MVESLQAKSAAVGDRALLRINGSSGGRGEGALPNVVRRGTAILQVANEADEFSEGVVGKGLDGFDEALALGSGGVEHHDELDEETCLNFRGGGGRVRRKAKDDVEIFRSARQEIQGGI